MKLYTEEQVKAMLISTDQFTPLHIDHLMNEIISIELPSNEEIIDRALEVGYTNNLFTLGAKWMRDKIQGGNK
jgi:hypothetical protein